MTALNLTPDEALALADQWCAGLTMNADSKGWGAILLVLAEEVRRLRAELEHEEQRVADMMADVNRAGHEVERLRADAERYRWLTENCLHSFSMTQEEPAEHTLVFEWRQASLDEAGWSIHDAIDKAMEATNAG